MTDIQENTAPLTSSPVYTDGSPFPRYYRSEGMFMKQVDDRTVQKYMCYHWKRDGQSCWEHWSSRETFTPDQLVDYLRVGGYHPCHEQEYEEIRKKYLRAHGIKSN